jgi:hypothetical protein
LAGEEGNADSPGVRSGRDCFENDETPTRVFFAKSAQFIENKMDTEELRMAKRVPVMENKGSRFSPKRA